MENWNLFLLAFIFNVLDCAVDVLWLRNVQHNQNRLHWTKYVTWIFEAFQSFKWNEHRSNKSTIYFSLEIAIERIVSFF